MDCDGCVLACLVEVRLKGFWRGLYYGTSMVFLFSGRGDLFFLGSLESVGCNSGSGVCLCGNVNSGSMAALAIEHTRGY